MVQAVRGDPAGLLTLQQAVGNQAIGRLIAGGDASVPSRPPVLAVQRAVIAHGPIDGLNVDLDTSDLAAATALIDGMWNHGKSQGLGDLCQALLIASKGDVQHKSNNSKLLDHINSYLRKTPEGDTNYGESGLLESVPFNVLNRPRDETGATKVPGQGEQFPAHPTATQTHALSIRHWQIGDIADSIGWKAIGIYLQGRMVDADYVKLGDDILAFHAARGQVHAGPKTRNVKRRLARGGLQRVANEIHVGLDQLPKTPGASYRVATSAPGVYGTQVNVGDHVMDKAFWSTSGLRLDGFGGRGTLAKPNVYYIINGSTGVFLPRYTNTEAGKKEILFNDRTIFRVTKITNYAERTFFVYVDEVDPTTLSPHTVTKNPWSGANN